MSKICLNMIVKNEEAIIEDCLASMLGIIDCAVICDTGSTDSTCGKVRDFLTMHNILTEIHFIDFKDFSHARNTAYAKCLSSNMPFDYVLLTDADMPLKLPATKPDNLTEDVYMLKIMGGENVYYRPQLLKRGINAKYIGVTHEYLDTGGARRVKLDDRLVIVDKANGFNRKDKFARDVELLLKDLETNPDNQRSMYYLGQSYKDMGNHEKAIEWYGKRAAAGGWKEEAWHAQYRKAQSFEHLDKDKAVSHYLAAYNMRPERAEPLYRLSQLYRNNKMHEAAMLMCEAAPTIIPPSDILFVENFIYEYGIQEEISVNGYFCSDPARKTKGKTACMQLSTNQAIPEEIRNKAVTNLHYYLHKGI